MSPLSERGVALLSYLAAIAPYIASALVTFMAVVACGHVILNKRDGRSAIGWVGLIWLAPLFGPTLYVILGINRIRRRGAELKAQSRRLEPIALPMEPATLPPVVIGDPDLARLARLVGTVTSAPLVAGNRVTPLVDGDAAYPAMLAAIDAAARSLALCSYIFDNDAAGRRFADALGRAVARGVEVRVLIDAAGASYSFPSIAKRLRRLGVRVALFLPTLLPGRVAYLNLRNHRKIMVVDGRLGFTGGMNIRDGNMLAEAPQDPTQDVHFEVRGPVVAHLMRALAEDWAFSARELLRGEIWFPPLEACGNVAARGIKDGPDEDYDKLRWTMLGGLACARRSVLIATPYFLPDVDIVTALSLAVLRGVTVDILLPEVNNLRLVKWASTAELPQVLEHGCRVSLNPPPFDHSKLMVVDGAWCLIGSGNWDPRSLKLNFEFNLECYDTELAVRLEAIIQQKLGAARRLSIADLSRRSLPVKLRDGLARLFAPYL